MDRKFKYLYQIPSTVKSNILILILSGTLFSVQIFAQELAWSRFRGPNGSGHATEEAKPPVNFGEEQNLIWKVEVPDGSSSPVVWKDHIYITGCIEDNNEMQLLCLNKNDGATLWNRSFFPDLLEGAHPISSPAQSTPALDKEGIYIYYASYGVISYDHQGNVRWKVPLNRPGHKWGHGASPAVMEDKVIVNQDFGGDNDRKLIALNKYTGEVVWKTLTQKESYLEGANYYGYSTPVRFKDQIIVHRWVGVAAYSLEDGSPVWWMSVGTTGTSSPIVVDSMIYVALWNHFSDKKDRGAYFDYEDFEKVIRDFDRDGDQLLSVDEIPDDFLIASRTEVAEYEGATHSLRKWFGFHDADQNNEVDGLEWMNAYNYFSQYFLNLGLVALRADHRGEISPEEIIWSHMVKIPEVPSPVIVNGFIYTVKDGGWVSCTDAATGKLVYSEKLGTTGGYIASPVTADGHIYIAGHRGIVHVIKASEKPEILSETRLQGKILATPVISGSDLYIRTSEYLYSFREK